MQFIQVERALLMCSMSAGCPNWGRTWGYALPGYVLLTCDLNESGILSRSNEVLVGFEVFCACDLDGSCNLSRWNGLCSSAVCLLGVRIGAELGAMPCRGMSC